MRLLLAANNQPTRRNEIIKSYLKTGFKQQPICTPLATTRNKIIYKTACSDGHNSGSGKASQPASLKRASLVALPVAISHKASLKPKRSASATLIQKTSKNEPKHGPKNGTAWRSHFWDRMHSKVKNRRKALSWSHFWDRLAVPKMRLQNRKNNSKGRPVQQTKNDNCV